jgi:predicted nucleotidyltransferase
MSLFEELIEDKVGDKKIVKSFTPKETLTDQIFEISGKNYVMRPEIRKHLLEISDDFIDSMGVEFFIHDVVLTGSLANFNWSSYSDVDLHILIDFKESKYNSDLVKEFFKSKETVWNNNHDIKVKGYDVEIYVQDTEEEHISSGVYSVLHNKWEVKPKSNKPNIDDRKILEKGEYFAKKIDQLIKLGTKKDVRPEIDTLRKKIKEFRQCGLEFGGEYSYENLVFKLLRRNGYIGKLVKLKTALSDKKLSITQ